MTLAYILHYFTVGLAMGLNSLGVGIAEGLTGVAAVKAIDKQPRAEGAIKRTAVINMALIETTALVAILTVLMLLFNVPEGIHAYYTSLSSYAIIFAVCISGLVIAVASALPAQAASNAIARQPFIAQKILTFTIMTMAIIQTPIIINFVLMVIMNNQAAHATCLAESLRLLATGVSIGLGCIGPVIGMSLFARSSCASIGVNPQAYPQIFSFTLISQAVIETPVVFSILISIIHLFGIQPLQEMQITKGIALLAASIAIGLGTFGTGISSGKTASSASKQIAHYPEESSVISRTSLVAQGLIETSAIYAVLLALILTFLL